MADSIVFHLTQLPSFPFVMVVDRETWRAIAFVDVVTALQFSPELPTELATVLSEIEARFLSNHPSLVLKQLGKRLFRKLETRKKLTVVIQ